MLVNKAIDKVEIQGGTVIVDGNNLTSQSGNSEDEITAI
jgi:hypothetical protein